MKGRRSLNNALISIDINYECGEAEVYFANAFLSLDPLLKADILQDLMHDMQDQYLVSRIQMRKAYTKIEDSFNPKEEQDNE